MKSSYKKLGPYIQEVKVKNKGLKVDKLLGVSITKKFIPSIANTVGTDMSKYKIVMQNQFAYGPVTSRNGEKISVALLEDDCCIISTSYTVFKIIDHNELLPEYLMMWFRRPEFDRYARYMSHGSVRELFGWDEMCEVELPIPDIDKQKEIVEEYRTVVDRIKLNEKLNQKLEETAQAIYKQWFVDFEFPMPKEHAVEIGKPEMEGKPYKSCGGKMVWNDELDKEIPEGWILKTVNDTVKLGRGSSPRPIVDYLSESGIPWIKIADATRSFNQFLLETKECIKSEGVPKSRLLDPGTLILANSGSLGTFQILDIQACAHDGWHIFYDWKLVSREFMTLFLQVNNDEILTSAYGSVFTNLKLDFLKDYPILIPCKELMHLFTVRLEKIESYQLVIAKEVQRITKLIELLLAKMTKAEAYA